MVAYNIVFAGETGVGKSSLINLLFDLEVSPTSNDILGVTCERKRFIAVRGSEVYRLWDTPGFNEGTLGNVSSVQAAKSLECLSKDLEAADGVHLLVFCFRFTKAITGGLQRVYKSVLSSVGNIKLSVVAAVTHADEMRQTSEVWWNGTSSQREEKGMVFEDYACVSTLEDGDHPPMEGRRNKARDDMWQLIKSNAKQLLSPGSLPKEINIILFGQTGVGKSSIVNLIAGAPIADVSADVVGCTMSSTEYRFIVGPHQYRIWDTVGLEEAPLSMDGYFKAILKALLLIRKVASAGGVNLLLFCMQGSRITRTVQCNYRLFYEMFCEKQVPVGLVITYLEREKDMEDWWTRNERSIHDYGIKNIGHACVTGLPNPIPPEKLVLSRAAIYGLLTDCDRLGRYTVSPDVWFKRLLKSMKNLLQGGLPRGEKLMQALMTRGGLTEEHAKRLRKHLEDPQPEEPSGTVANIEDAA
ncbi:P-loop containing nucleoside triphosphate hydrolase protein [Scleroderma yunnanense]